MKNTALLIIDVQNALVMAQPYNKDEFINSLKKLILTARENSLPIIYVQHDGGEGDELCHGTEGWEIYKDISPLDDEMIIEKKLNSAFKNTDLQKKLAGIDTLIIAGMQTEYCIDTTVKSAFDLGYKIYVPEKCTTTFGGEYMSGEKMCQYYEKAIWHGRFAQVITLDKLTEKIKEKSLQE